MTRIIKFRGKRIDNGEWVFGSLDLTGERPAISWIRTDEEGDMTPWFAYVGADTVGQFTGMCDKNSKEIYEGDIVRNKKGNIDVITYDSLAFALCVAYATSPNGVCATFFGDNNPLKDLEVIGNIHDNPQLCPLFRSAIQNND